ncbi:hypothetical protein DESUT3_31050 [Desulfuromonas versatilis]|uniref:Nucleotide-binding protein n=1 Tax=Desulfuromonas versatilis TaxID=2802975 RepID=A0ABM8HUN2_9BACT|nr:DNA-binding protein [Desulfuromonas versatilis]BCR06036.1 hypothetical protein DESUT3_31050 [Desulfuromonas versatilis]
MKKRFSLMLAGMAALALAAGCKDEAPKTAPAPEPAAQQQPAAQPAASPGKSGKVVETMNSGGYTYVKVDTGSEQFWAAAPEFVVQVGDPVAVPEGMPMVDYHSKTLDRTFDMVYFVPAVMVGGAAPAAAAPAGMGSDMQMPEGHPPINGSAGGQAQVDLSGIAKAEGGQTVAEVFAGKGDLSGKEITLRGKVVKFSPEIMGKNWIHIQDGTGGEGTNDLTVTTSAVAKVGDTVLVTGKLTTDKDFGYGYKYDIILEDAQVNIE